MDWMSSLNRRAFLVATAALIASRSRVLGAGADDGQHERARLLLKNLEHTFAGRLGVFALDMGSGKTLEWRADERFPVCSTFKVLAAAAVLARDARTPGLMEQVVAFDQSNLVAHSPITQKHVGTGMTVSALCAAALRYSDNTAGNLLLRLLGGPAALTAYARALGDTTFRLDRWETALNTALPGDKRDTSTPRAMGHILRRLVLGDALPSPQRAQLCDWMLGNTTGDKRIRAGTPKGWKVADKTGGGDYGTTNDIAVLWPPQGAPLVLAIYITQHVKDTPPRNEEVAAATRLVMTWQQTF